MDPSAAIAKVCKKRGKSASSIAQPPQEMEQERTVEKTPPPPATEEPRIEQQPPTPEPVEKKQAVVEQSPSPLPSTTKEEKPASAQKARLEPGKPSSAGGKKT